MNPEDFLNKNGTTKIFKLGDFISETHRSFEFIRADSLKTKRKNWLIENYFEKESLGLIFADPGACKSFAALSISAAIATGTAWFGQEVSQGAVFFIAGEGFNGLAKRLKAWETHYGISLKGAPLYLSKRAAQFYDQESAEAVTSANES